MDSLVFLSFIACIPIRIVHAILAQLRLSSAEGRETSSAWGLARAPADMVANTKRIEVSRKSLTSSLEPRMVTGMELQLLKLDRKLDRAASKLATH